MKYWVRENDLRRSLYVNMSLGNVFGEVVSWVLSVTELCPEVLNDKSILHLNRCLDKPSVRMSDTDLLDETCLRLVHVRLMLFAGSGVAISRGTMMRL